MFSMTDKKGLFKVPFVFRMQNSHKYVLCHSELKYKIILLLNILKVKQT